MTTKVKRRKSQSSEAQPALAEILVSGFKSLRDEQRVEVRPLTILAGANSSGKSSLFQPVLLMKQTLEASFDPGPLLLNGPNVKCTSTEQILSRSSSTKSVDGFSVGIAAQRGELVCSRFARAPTRGFTIERTTVESKGESRTVHAGMSSAQIKSLKKQASSRAMELLLGNSADWQANVVQRRCFLDVQFEDTKREGFEFGLLAERFAKVEAMVQSLIHIPALRGNPERTYPITAVGTHFPGTFEKYVASIIAHWQSTKREKLDRLCKDLERLGLTWKVQASHVNDTQVELQVGRLLQAKSGGARDLVNVADVGFGVSQVLPVLVALHAAEPGQTIYVEQPELHLHPRAQTTLAEVIADAVKRGVQVIAETHSHTFLLAVQTYVAEGKLPPDLVMLHWFRRKKDGSTEIISAELDENGAYGDWPMDFDFVALEADHRYLSAAARKRG